MKPKPKPIRGMNDVLPDATATWRYLEEVVREVVESYGYREIRLPLVGGSGGRLRRARHQASVLS